MFSFPHQYLNRIVQGKQKKDKENAVSERPESKVTPAKQPSQKSKNRHRTPQKSQVNLDEEQTKTSTLQKVAQDECTPLKDDGGRDSLSNNEKSEGSKEDIRLSKLALAKQKTAPLRKTRPAVDCGEHLELKGQ